MSQTRYRQPEPEPQTPPVIAAFAYDAAVSRQQRAIGEVLRQAALELFNQQGGREIDHAIALLDAFAVEGAQYAKNLLRAEPSQTSPRPDETKLPQGSEPRQLVKQARRQKPVIDAASAARLCKLLVDLLTLRKTLLGKLYVTEEQLLMVVTDNAGYDTKLEPSQVLERLRELHRVM